MNKLKNDLLLRTLKREPVSETPIWIMRQAGRYLPEYRQIRQQAGSFMTLCKTPELACQVTLQPLERFPLDAAILFSDILTIPDAMGLGLSFKEGEGPHFARTIKSAQDVKALGVPDPDVELKYVLDAIRLIKQELDGKVPLIGFCGSPWTLAAYMVEGKSNKEFPAIKNMMQADPKTLHQLLNTLAESVTAHLNAQIKAGVQVVMLFDTWGGLLKTSDYKEFSLRYCQQIIANLTNEVNGESIPSILFTKGGGQWLSDMATTGCTALGLDWEVDLQKARAEVGDLVILQGNMDPLFLYKEPEIIRNEVSRILAQFGSGGGHIFNLGHGILPDVPYENVAVLVEAVHELSRPYHG